MKSKRRAPFVALTALLRRRLPDVCDPEQHIARGLVLVDGSIVSNPRARVRADASIKILDRRLLRGTVKLTHAIRELSVNLTGTVAVDIGAAAGGFTQALLDAGAARVYAVDAGFGQLRGHLRVDPRVVNMERTNLGSLDVGRISETVQMVTVDLSYLSLSRAAAQIGRLRLARGARLLALVKPTYELHAMRLAAAEEEVAAAVAEAQAALDRAGWNVRATVPSPVRGASGAVEVFVYAERR
jgi:23S rRNA (cytidine1920-2'-O)/16S rRNA (cytidine1409-2'-O)-methyltransferase